VFRARCESFFFCSRWCRWQALVRLRYATTNQYHSSRRRCLFGRLRTALGRLSTVSCRKRVRQKFFHPPSIRTDYRPVPYDRCSCGWCQADDFGFCTELDGGWCLQVNAFAPSCSRNEPAAVEGPTAGLAHRLRSVRSSPSCSAVNCSACLSSHGCGWCEQAHSCLDLQSVYSSCSEPLIQNHSTCSRASGAAVSALLRNAAVVGLWLALFFSFHGVR
jgi:hypothetical protein